MQGNKQTAMIKKMVSRNRNRYADDEFNLDMSYITHRVVAMGFPGEGVFTLYRNAFSDVLKYFEKYHESRVKVYNMCNDDFVDTNRLGFKEYPHVKIAYFPMLDHNPGPISYLYKFVFDMSLFLTQDARNVCAVHCKAGKGRTGLAISAYILFCEAAGTVEDALRMFNIRRTSNGKGMAIPSQIRYLNYFCYLLEANFKRPYVQALAPFTRDPACFDYLLKPERRLKLLTVVIGPFSVNPDGLKIKVKLRDFATVDLFAKSSKMH